MTLGLWAIVACLFNWDTCLGVIDIRATGEALGDDDLARWVIGAGGLLMMLVGLLCIV